MIDKTRCGQQEYLLFCNIPNSLAALFKVPVAIAACAACLTVVKLMAHWTLADFTFLFLTANLTSVQAVWICYI
jgi:hypothetical protein